MHPFTDLVDRCTVFTLRALREANEETSETLQTGAANSLVKTLQMVQLQKAISAVGMFSLFEAILQDRLECKDGLAEAALILHLAGEAALGQRFNDLRLAINVLKHGRGRSYDDLVARADFLIFKIKLPEEPCFHEGDVSEVSTLIKVDDAFVLSCADVIRDVSTAIRKARPEAWL